VCFVSHESCIRHQDGRVGSKGLDLSIEPGLPDADESEHPAPSASLLFALSCREKSIQNSDSRARREPRQASCTANYWTVAPATSITVRPNFISQAILLKVINFAVPSGNPLNSRRGSTTAAFQIENSYDVLDLHHKGTKTCHHLEHTRAEDIRCLTQVLMTLALLALVG
jgi:hypothetical protein